MDGERQQMLAKIKEAIENGSLTKNEIERRLNAAIDAEIQKKDSPADMQLITACQNLLWEINMHGKPYRSNKEQSLRSLIDKLNKKESRQKRQKYAFGFATALVVLIVGGFAIDALLKSQWLEGTSSHDEQQYVISGQEINPGIIDPSQADNALQTHTITTTNLNEALTVLGHIPLMPTWVPDGWAVENYYANHIGNITSFGIRYQRAPDEDLLRFSITTYSDAESAIYEFEQGKTGIETQCNGWTVYVSENTDAPMAVWREDTACYSITGPISKDELLQIIQSIQRSVDS